MIDGRFLSPQFCDDVRQEIGNKFSLMGCYGPSMLLETFPVTLPKLCAQVRVYTPANRPFARLSVRLMQDRELMGEMTFPHQALAAQPPNIEYLADARWQMFNVVIVLSPFHIEKPCRLSIEADTEDGVISGGSFWIDRAVPKTEA